MNRWAIEPTKNPTSVTFSAIKTEWKDALSGPVHRRLSELVSSALRFHLRRLLNDPPAAATTPSGFNIAVENDDHAPLRSKVHQLIRLAPSSQGKAWHQSIKDGVLASVVSHALRAFHTAVLHIQRVSDTAGKEIGLVEQKHPSEALDDGSSQSSAEALTLLRTDQSNVLVENMQRHVLLLRGERARLFLRTILMWPGLEAAVQSAGGWVSVERLAGIIAAHDLHDEACMSLLADMGKLRKLLAKPLLHESSVVRMNLLEKRILARVSWLERLVRTGNGSRRRTKGVDDPPPVDVVAPPLAICKLLTEEPLYFPRLKRAS